MATVDLNLPISEILHKGTVKSHDEVAKSPGAAALVNAALPREEYVRFLMILWHIYGAIEEALERHAANTVLQPTHNPILLARKSSLSADISAVLQVPESSWQAHPIYTSLMASPPPALTAYTSRITDIESTDPSLLLAHSYARYLGDLSGGQVIKHRTAKAYGLDEQSNIGLSFYAFRQLGSSVPATSQGDMKKIKVWFKAGMDAGVGDDAKLKEALLREANIAFELNAGLLHDLSINEKQKPVVPILQPIPTEKTYSVTTVFSVITAICLAHFLLVIGGFTGPKGYSKLLAAEQWVASLLS
ncbi:heme oxygenase-like protein [Pleurotus eryngii]|uniref:Heme oxygenase-like protein n=1 Tax=Pleurotus eryngii TaxID=5323 RepID=A0A9P5ZYX5_PLEER|nr:heme oxygenase-like protein [Pleurotus eryngii]